MRILGLEVVVDVYKGGIIVMLAIITLISLIIICATIIIGMYIYYCAQNNVKAFVKPEYNATLNELKREVHSSTLSIIQLKKEVQEMKNDNKNNCDENEDI